MDISDISLQKGELEELMKFQESDKYIILKKMCMARMEALKEESIFNIGNDPHGAGLRQGEYQVLSLLITLPYDSGTKLKEMKQEENKKTIDK